MAESAPLVAIADVLLANTPAGVVVYEGESGRCVVANRAVAEMVGGSVEAMRAQNFREIGSWREAGLAELAEATLRDGRPRHRDDAPMRTTFGKLVSLDCFVSRFDIEGRPHLMIIVSDVTERREAETALAVRERELRTLVEHVPDLIVRWDRSLHRTYVNPAWERAAGLAAADVVGAAPGLPAASAGPRFVEKLRAVLETGAPQREELSVVNARGERLHLEYLMVPEHDRAGGISGVLAVGHDLTAHRNAEEELRRHRDHLEELIRERTAELTAAKEEAEAANRAKSAFLASMSHELRTPLNAVLGFSQLMRRDATPAQRESLDIILRSGEHLLALIDNVLEISRIESGRVELEEAAVDLPRLLEEIASLVHARAREKGLEFALLPSPDLPRLVAGDGGKLRQVLLNLVGNATKFTARGGVTLRARALRRKDGAGLRARFEVADTGPGVPEEARARIFQPFVQLGRRPGAEAGSGLGLAICKQYVELMGGEIGVAAAPGGGALFHFEIPVRELAAASAPAPRQGGRAVRLADGQPRRRLLIAEDQPENRLLLRRMLEPLGFDLREAADGAEAVAVAEAWHPDLVWMDIRMPVMDGLEATRRIKAGAAGGGPRVVAITAHALEEERRAILAAGCDDFVRKPFAEAALVEVLTRQLGVRFVHEDGPVAAAPPPLDAAALARLPDPALAALEQALVRLDVAAIGRAVDGVRPHQPDLAEALAGVARDLQLGRMLRLVRAARGAAGARAEHG